MSPNSYSRIVVLVAALGLLSSPAFAQKRGTKKTVKRTHTRATQPKAASKVKAKNYDFLADDIDGERVLPDNTTIFGREKLVHDSLIHLRTDFIAEIVGTADRL